MADEIRTIATFHIVCNLPFGTPCEHHNCCHFADLSKKYSHLEPLEDRIVWCQYAKPSKSHIDCKEIE